MAKFSNNSAEEVHNRQVKIGGQPSLTTKTAFEKFAQLENAVPPVKPSSFNKPAPLKPPLGTKPSLHDSSDKDPKPSPLKNTPVASKVAALAQAVSREAIERPGFPKPLGLRPTEGLRQEPKPLFPKPSENRLPSSVPLKNEIKLPGLRPSLKHDSQESEAKPVFPKVKEKISPSQEDELKPPFSKPPLREKPGLHPIHTEEASNKNVNLIRAPSGAVGLKPKVSSLRAPKEAEKKSNNGMDSTTSPFPPLKHVVSNQRSSSPILQKTLAQQNEEGRSSVIKNISRFNQEDSGSISGSPSAKFVSSVKGATTGPWANNSEKEEKDKNLPKRKALPPLFKLGPPPQKPSRPPTVDLEKFRKNNGESSNKLPSAGLPPPLPPSSSITQVAAPQPPEPAPPPPPPPPPSSHPSAQAPPVLPPRNIKPRPQENEENYDDAEFISGGTGSADEGQNNGAETYEDINDMRPTTREEERRKEKEERKKSDQEKKKEQKEKEKKEQEIRKKFKLVGPIEVIHQARACTDFKGGKNDLSFKQGDQIEIIRITDNPEGKWLGRTRGSYGYIKTTMVEIDYDSLRRKPRPSINIQPRQQDSDQEVYDDVGDQDNISSGGQSITGMGFPPPPSPDIYDGVENVDDGPARGSSAKQAGKDSGDSDVYDDVEPTDFPPPPKEISLGINMKSSSFGKPRSDERDSQKLKKMEKEEREFRKKFKFEGDIHVLYSTTISRAPSQKKRGSKDLQVRPGESVDVIKNVDDTKVLCRNEEGKYGYVRRSCIVNEDDEIYDDIADDVL